MRICVCIYECFRDLYLWSCTSHWLDIVYSEVCPPHSRRQKGIPDFLTTSSFHILSQDFPMCGNKDHCDNVT